MVQRGRRRRLSTREDEGKPEDRERQRRGLSQRAAQPCRHGADNVMQGEEEEESTRRVVMTQALLLAVPESRLYAVLSAV